MSFQREYLERCVDESFFGFGCNFVNNLFGFWVLGYGSKTVPRQQAIDNLKQLAECHFSLLCDISLKMLSCMNKDTFPTCVQYIYIVL